MGQLSEQLKKYMVETPKEIQEQHFHAILCEMYGIDPDDPKSKKNLRKKQFKEKLKYTYWPAFKKHLTIFSIVMLFMACGACLVNNCILWAIVDGVLGAFMLSSLTEQIKRDYWR